jgi:uncharacterized protein YbdZ (MbtH family)
MTASLLDDENAWFYVVVNDEGQHAIWPGFSAAPDGWRMVAGPADRRSCLEYIEERWTDMRPASLRAAR